MPLGHYFVVCSSCEGVDCPLVGHQQSFLHKDLDKEVYISPPRGYECKRNKSLHGLKQTSSQWNAKLIKTLLVGFFQS